MRIGIIPTGTAIAASLALTMSVGCGDSSDGSDSDTKPTNGDADRDDAAADSEEPADEPSDDDNADSPADDSGDDDTNAVDESDDDTAADDTTDSTADDDTADDEDPGAASDSAADDSASPSDDEPAQDDTSDPDEASATDDDDAAGDDSNRPEIVVEESEDYAAGLEPRDSTFGTDEDGDFRWLFTVENTSEEAVCIDLLPAKLYDKDGNVLAGSDPTMIIPEPGVPIFAASVVGSSYRGERNEVVNCIGPGEHGLGRGNAMSSDGAPLDVERLLNDGARVEYFFFGATDGSNLEPASELLVIEQAELTQGDDGAVVSGTASNDLALLEWTIHAALYDEGGRIVDFVSTSGSQWPEGEELEFELPAGDPDAASFELYSEVTIWQ
jgi:hypothetical protein